MYAVYIYGHIRVQINLDVLINMLKIFKVIQIDDYGSVPFGLRTGGSMNTYSTLQG